MPLTIESSLLELLNKILNIAGDQPVYLVGGAVRDLLLGKTPHDLDFAVPSGSIALAKAVRKALDGVGYTLDDERQTARVILKPATPAQQVLDFVSFTGESLADDLRNRDYTVNAMALALDAPNQLLDPLGGAEDLQKLVLRVPNPLSIEQDPLRAFRAVRLMRQFGLQCESETKTLIERAAPMMRRVAGERVRDELFRLIETPDFASSLRLIQASGLLNAVFPHAEELLSLERVGPHVHDLWEHTLQVIHYTESLIAGKSLNPPQDFSGAYLSSACLALKPYRKNLQRDLNEPLQGDRPRASLLLLAAFYHDIGKPGSRTLKADGRFHFHDHPAQGLSMVEEVSNRFLLGAAEAKYLQLLVEHHMRLHNLSNPPGQVSRRAVYRYFQDMGPYGVDLALHSLADALAAKEVTIAPERWMRELKLSLMLMEVWYKKQREIVDPPKLVSGDELMRQFNLAPGPQLGQVLTALREAQAEGLVNDKESALAFCGKFLAGLQEEAKHESE